MSERYDEIVEKLLSDTRRKDVVWKPEGGQIQRENVQGFVYSTTVSHQKIVLYEYRYKHYDEFENLDWEREVAVEFVTGMSNVMELRFPPTSLRWSLLSEVRKQVSGLEDFAKRFLDSKEEQ